MSSDLKARSVIRYVLPADWLRFDREAVLRNIRRVTPQATVLEVSARTGAGMDRWYTLLQSHVAPRVRHAP